MGIAERKERQKKEVRDSILQAAWQLVREEGWQALSIRKIADAIEYSVPVVYDHFENKEAILFEFSKQGFKLLADRINNAKSSVAGPSAQLEAMAFAYWDFAFKNKEFYMVMYGLGMPGCEQVQRMPELMEFTATIKNTIEQIVETNGAKDINSFLKLNSFWSMLHGLVSINLMTPPPVHGDSSPEEINKMIMNDFIKSFIKGLS